MDENIINNSKQSTENSPDSNITDTSSAETVSFPVEETAEMETSTGEVVESVTQVIEFPEYTEFNPLPVYVVDEVIPDIATFALTNTYPGTISDTYLDYFEGIVQKLDFNEHYVVWRSGAYSYTMAYGEDLILDENTFTGACDYVQIYRDGSDYSSTWYVAEGSDQVSLDTSGLFAYSDLGMYSTLERGLGSVEANTILFSIGVLFVYVIGSRFFDFIGKRIFRT